MNFKRIFWLQKSDVSRHEAKNSYFNGQSVMLFDTLTSSNFKLLQNEERKNDTVSTFPIRSLCGLVVLCLTDYSAGAFVDSSAQIINNSGPGIKCIIAIALLLQFKNIII